MKLGRIWRQGPDGDVARIVAVHPDEGHVVDLATAEGARLQRAGATPEAARRLSSALFPLSMAAGIALYNIGSATKMIETVRKRQPPPDAKHWKPVR